MFYFFFSSRRRHTRYWRDWSSDVCSSDLSSTSTQAVCTVILDVQTACVDVLLAKANLALAQENLQAFNDIVQVNAARVRAGDLAPVELERTRLAALQFQNEVRQKESNLFIARNQLQTLLGRRLPAS